MRFEARTVTFPSCSRSLLMMEVLQKRDRHPIQDTDVFILWYDNGYFVNVFPLLPLLR